MSAGGPRDATPCVLEGSYGTPATFGSKWCNVRQLHRRPLLFAACTAPSHLPAIRARPLCHLRRCALSCAPPSRRSPCAQVEAVAAGREHAVVSTSEGKVFTWGGRDLLLGRSGSPKEPGQALVSRRGAWKEQAGFAAVATGATCNCRRCLCLVWLALV